MQISSFVSDSYIINLCLGYQLCLICPLILLYFLTLLHRNPGIFSPYVWTLPSKSYLPFCLKQEYSYLCGQGGDVTMLMTKSLYTKLRQPWLTSWWLSLLPLSRPPNCLRLSPIPLATSTRNIQRNLCSTVHHADRWTDDLPAASSVEKRGTSSPTVRPAQSSSAYSASKRALAIASRLEDKSWSYLSPRMTPTLTPTYS